MIDRPRLNVPLTITIFFWALNFIAVKEVYLQMSAPALALARFLLMWVCLVVLCLVRKEPLKIEPGDAWKVLFFGFLSMGFYMILFLGGMKGTTAPVGAIILATAPVFTALGAIAIGQDRFRWSAIVGALIAFSGVAMVVGSGLWRGLGDLGSNLVVFASAIVWSGTALYMRPLLGRYSPIRLFTISMPGALIPMVGFGLHDAFRVHWRELTWVTWVSFLHIALLSGVAGFALFYRGVQEVGSARAVGYQFFTPIATTALSVLILGTRLSLVEIVGTLVVVAGLWYARRPDQAPLTARSPGKLA